MGTSSMTKRSKAAVTGLFTISARDRGAETSWSRGRSPATIATAGLPCNLIHVSEQPLKLILKAPKQTFFRGKETADSLRAMFWILGEVLHPGKPYAAARLFMNRFADHRQSLVRNLKHVVRRRDVVCEFGDHFLVTDAARFELTPGNEIVAVQDLGHIGLLKLNSSG